eukprot:GHVP01046294.1.p1 GENE.GHVP01046294.1~~GHVP01046294.1.p1  ORF type:complete len:465 (-),score=83.70 GHVP01046294.1:264-1658(-)
MKGFASVLLSLYFTRITSKAYKGREGDLIGNVDIILTSYGTDWCGHCKTLAPTLEKLKDRFKDEPRVDIVRVDCGTNQDLCKQKGIQGYPTLIVTYKGQETEYSQGRGEEELHEAITHLLNKKITEFESEEEIKDFIKKDSVTLIGKFADTQGKGYTEFMHYAHKNLANYNFGTIIDKKEESIVTLYRKEDGGKETLSNITEEELEKFVEAHKHPQFAEIGPDNYSYYLNSERPLGYLFFSNDKEKELFNIAKEKVRELKISMNFVIIDATKFGMFADTLSLQQKWPCMAIQRNKERLKYILQEANETSIAEFITNFHADKIDPTFKSREEKADNNGPLLELVRSNFQNNVFDESKDVLVAFCAAWCPHCEKLIPILEEIGEKVNKDELLIAKVDVSENDIEDIIKTEITGYPTVYLYPAGCLPSDYIEFSGNRTEKELIDFIKKNGVNKSSIKEQKETEKDDL